MDIKKLDINQCPGDYFTPNAFKRTHKCDDKTSYVSIYKYSKNWTSFISKYFFSSVCQFKAEVSRLEATNACANKDMNILLRILLTTLTDRGWMQSSRAWWRANPTGSTCTNVVLLVSPASHPPSPSRCLLPSSASSSDPSSTDREKAWNLFCCDSSQILT